MMKCYHSLDIDMMNWVVTKFVKQAVLSYRANQLTSILGCPHFWTINADSKTSHCYLFTIQLYFCPHLNQLRQALTVGLMFYDGSYTVQVSYSAIYVLYQTVYALLDVANAIHGSAIDRYSKCVQTLCKITYTFLHFIGYTMSQGKDNARLKSYKNKSLNTDEMRRRREEEGLQLRKQKKDEQVRMLQKSNGWPLKQRMISNTNYCKMERWRPWVKVKTLCLCLTVHINSINDCEIMSH